MSDSLGTVQQRRSQNKDEAALRGICPDAVVWDHLEHPSAQTERLRFMTAQGKAPLRAKSMWKRTRLPLVQNMTGDTSYKEVIWQGHFRGALPASYLSAVPEMCGIFSEDQRARSINRIWGQHCST